MVSQEGLFVLWKVSPDKYIYAGKDIPEDYIHYIYPDDANKFPFKLEYYLHNNQVAVTHQYFMIKGSIKDSTEK
jgi:hypothetical protein